MNRKTVALIGAIAVLAVIAVLWLTAGSRRSQSSSAASQESDQAAEAARLRARGDLRGPRVDPRQKERGRIRGTVRDEQGQGIAAARVCALLGSDELGSEDTREPSCVIAGQGGRYSLDRLVEGTYRLFASAPGRVPARYRTQGVSRREGIDLAAGQERDSIDIVLKQGGAELHGVVRDIGGGPVASALISVARGRFFWNEDVGFVHSDNEGKFSAWVEPGAVHVSATVDGYSPGEADGVAPGQTLEVLLVPESGLSGIVVEAGTKNPVAGALVAVGDDERGFGPGGDDQASKGSAISDESGRFRITRLGPGRYKPTATAAGRHGQTAESVLLGLGEMCDDLVIEVHPAFLVTGKVVIATSSTDSKPCPNSWVSLIDKDSGSSLDESGKEDGSIVFKAVFPGTYKVSVWCRDFLEEETYPPIVISDKDVLDSTWQVKPGAAITGRVLDSDRKPVAGAVVRAQVVKNDPRGQRSWGWGRSEGDGSFSLAGLVAATYHVTVDAEGYEEVVDPIEVAVTAGESKAIEVVLSAGGTIVGTVVDEDGHSVSGVQVTAVSDRMSVWRDNTRSKDDGSFELRGVRPGTVRVEASRGWRDTMRAPGQTDDDVPGERVTVVAGQVAKVKLVVEDQSGQITGQVVDASGNPVGDAFVSAQRESDAAGARRENARRWIRWSSDQKPELTTSEGKFTIGKLSPGTYTLRAYRKGGGEAFAEGVRVGSRARLVIEHTGSIAGTVTVADGKPADEFTITVDNRKAAYSRSEPFFRTGGSFAVRDLPAGEFRISVSAKGGTAETTVPLTDGEDRTGVFLRLESRTTVKGKVVSLDDGSPVSGMLVLVQPVGGAGGVQFTLGRDDEKKHITDASGQFEIESAPAGRVYIQVFPLNWQESAYGFMRLPRTVPGGGTYDAGEIALPRRRLADPRDQGGDLGYELVERPPDAELEAMKLEVALVRPDGPAAKSGLKKGDVITSIDGRDVTGANVGRYFTLSRVPAGTEIQLGLAGGRRAAITAGPPR